MKEIFKTFISLIILLILSTLIYLAWIINKGEFTSQYLEKFINDRFKSENFYTSIKNPRINFDKEEMRIIVDGENFNIFSIDDKKISEFKNLKVYINFLPLITKRKLVTNKIEININEKDIRIDTYRASGAGGQHVNKTDSAVRITHLPTKIVVQCQNNRSQHKNKATALSMLRARIYEMELQKKESEQELKNQNKSEIGWGRQIRSYVMHPYKMVKDLRNNTEVPNCNSVLDGNIDVFLEAALFKKN